MEFIKITCVKCKQIRKTVKDTPRHLESICGECWDWNK